MNITKKISEEIDSYLNTEVELSEGVKFSQARLVKRIGLYQNQVYPRGKTDSQGNYKHWMDITTPRVNSEIKNIDFDTKDISVYSENTLKDKLAVFLGNLYLRDWLIKNNKGQEINDAVEDFSSWGNIVWKKTKDEYGILDLKNFYVLNQTARTLDDSDAIERHLLTQSELRDKSDSWENIDEVIKNCGNMYFNATEKSSDIDTTSPIYEVYERNGEISEKDLFEAQGKQGGDKDKYILAKVIVTGIKKGSGGKDYVLFADTLDEKPYKEAHRGKYKGRWFREGLYELLFDCQTRANEIGNQLARGLEWSAKTIFRSADTLIIQNALTDMRSGDIIKSKDLEQVAVRMQGMDQLIADWNRNIQLANELSNSYEIITGENMPAATPFRLGVLQNQNANKLYDFLREKLSLALEELFDKWIIPIMMKELRTKKILDMTGDEDHLKEYKQMLVDAWYINNLLLLPPHANTDVQALKEFKLQEIEQDKNLMLKTEEGFWKGFQPRAKIVISGENVNLMAELETLYSFINVEMDPVRRSALIELAMAKKGLDLTGLPKSPPQPLPAPVAQQNQQPQTPQQNIRTPLNSQGR